VGDEAVLAEEVAELRGAAVGLKRFLLAPDEFELFGGAELPFHNES
jgi:hypothetical protein